jgi:hypothetical protein
MQTAEPAEIAEQNNLCALAFSAVAFLQGCDVVRASCGSANAMYSPE